LDDKLFDMKDNQLEAILVDILHEYPRALGVNFFSMELPVNKSHGDSKLLDKYKDIPMLSMDEAFNTSFSFIVTEHHSIVIFFIEQLHFVSILTDTTDPNKELATKFYNQYKDQLTEAIEKEHKSQFV